MSASSPKASPSKGIRHRKGDGELECAHSVMAAERQRGQIPAQLWVLPSPAPGSCSLPGILTPHPTAPAGQGSGCSFQRQSGASGLLEKGSDRKHLQHWNPLFCILSQSQEHSFMDCHNAAQQLTAFSVPSHDPFLGGLYQVCSLYHKRWRATDVLLHFLQGRANVAWGYLSDSGSFSFPSASEKTY